MNYICPRCNYSTKYRGNFKSHLNRKKKCSSKNLNINVDKINIDSCKKYMNIKSPIKYKCDCCNKVYLSRQGKYQHMKKYCKFKQINNIELNKKSKIHSNENQQLNSEELLEKLLDMNYSKKDATKFIRDLNNITNNQNITNNTNNSFNTTNNNTNNFNIYNYGDEDISHVTTDMLKHFITDNPYKSIPNLVSEIHFNKKYPKNRNIVIINKREPYVLIHFNGGWLLKNKTEFMSDIIRRKSEILDSCFEKIKSAISDHEKDKYDTYKLNRDGDAHHRNNIILDVQIDIVNDSSQRDDLTELSNIFKRNQTETIIKPNDIL